MAELGDFAFSTIPEKGQSSRGRCSETEAKIKNLSRSFGHTILVNNILKFDDDWIKTVGGDSFGARQVEFSRFSRKNALNDL